MPRLLHLATGVVLIALAAEARAGIRHIVREGDSLGSISELHYGSSWKHVYIAGVNGLDDPRKVNVGQRLKIPVVWKVRVRSGERLSSVARRLLGDTRRASFLARFNGIDEKGKLDKGQTLLIPILVHHKVKRGESLTTIAKRYFRNSKMRFTLRDYNFLSTMKVEPGRTVVVPIFDKAALSSTVERRVRKSRALAAKRPGNGHKPRPPKAQPAKVAVALAAPAEEVAAGDTAIESAEALYAEGYYQKSAKRLTRLLPKLAGETPQRRARAHRALAFCYVALGQRAEAVEQFRRMLEALPTATLDPIRTSPKILELFEPAREERTTTTRDE